MSDQVNIDDLPNPEQYFDGKRFVSTALGDKIMQKYNFITMDDNDSEIYIYKDGVYVRDGAINTIRLECEKELGDMFKEPYVNAVLYYIQTKTFKNRKEINTCFTKINVKNGIYNLETNILEPHTPDYLSTIQIPVNYNINAKCPDIDKFLMDILTPDDILLIMQMFGYSLIPVRNIQKAFMYVGSGANGKGTLLRLHEAFIGEENFSSVPLQKLNEDKFAVANLYGKLLNVCGDIPNKPIDDDTMFKALVGRDTIEGERKYEMGFKFKPFSLLVFSANDLPIHLKANYSYFRRWVLVSFENKFEGNKEDKELDKKLHTPEELSGLLNYALIALHWLLETNEYHYFKTPEQVGEEYNLKSNPIDAFMKQCTIPSEDSISKTVLYDQYKAWCENNKIDKILSNNLFFRTLKRMGFDEIRPYENGLLLPRAIDGVKLNFPGFEENPEKTRKKPGSDLAKHYINLDKYNDFPGYPCFRNLSIGFFEKKDKEDNASLSPMETEVESTEKEKSSPKNPENPENPENQGKKSSKKPAENMSELTKEMITFADKYYTGIINTSNIIEYSLKFVELMKPKYPIKIDGKYEYYKPSSIKLFAEKIFKVTPGV